MKNFTFFLLLIITAAGARSQNIERSVIASAGATDKVGNYSLEWTLGEPVSASTYTDNRLYTQGFNQPTLKVKYKTITDRTLVTYKLTVAPNPVQSVLNVYWWSEQESAISLRLTDSYGRILATKSIALKTGNTSFNMQNLASGMYFLQVRNTKGLLINTYQIIKAQ